VAASANTIAKVFMALLVMPLPRYTTPQTKKQDQLVERVGTRKNARNLPSSGSNVSSRMQFSVCTANYRPFVPIKVGYFGTKYSRRDFSSWCKQNNNFNNSFFKNKKNKMSQRDFVA